MLSRVSWPRFPVDALLTLWPTTRKLLRELHTDHRRAGCFRELTSVHAIRQRCYRRLTSLCFRRTLRPPTR